MIDDYGGVFEGFSGRIGYFSSECRPIGGERDGERGGQTGENAFARIERSSE
jgi:hypothetical protein